MAPGDVKQRVGEMLAGDWGVVAGVDGFLLLRKGETTKEIPDAFYDFARVLNKTTALEDDQPLRLNHAEVEDWPRWRQTKVITQWHVGKNFSQQPMSPNLDIRTPSGQTLYTLAETLPPTLAWYPPEQWQTGETIRITSLPLYLPKIWGLVAEKQGGWELVEAYTRETDDHLVRNNTLSDFENISATGLFHFTSQEGTQQTISVDAALPNTSIWPGGLLDIQLRWSDVDTWPSHLNAFVHLRQNNENRSQSDGPPRHFVDETWQVVIGLYEPQSGQRADLLDSKGQPIGNEFVVGEVKIVSHPLVDQACGLIPATCP